MPNKTEYLLSSLTKSIDHLSHSFLEKPYITNPQGEGTDAEFDSAPLYRFDGFDCVTFVNNILALSLSHNLSEFQKKLLQINYYHAEAKYENRFHFMSLDWNPQNRKNNIVRDVTCEILDEKKNPIAIFAEGEIDKPNWFLKKSENETDARKKLLKKYSEKFKKEIVRPNWNLREKIGTNLHVSHLGFAIRKKSGELFFRHASSENKCVVEILLSDYLKNVLDSPTIKGINVQVMLAN